MKNCLLLLKVVAGNDDVKLAIADCGLLHSAVKVILISFLGESSQFHLIKMKLLI